MKPKSRTGDITTLLKRWSLGDGEALKDLFSKVYDQMHRMAHGHFYRESEDHLLQTTALVNEAYLQLAKGRKPSLNSRLDFFRYVGKVMRHILVNHAREQRAIKRGGGVKPIPLESADIKADELALTDASVLALDQALEKLQILNPRHSTIVELRFFAGMNHREIATALGLSPKTVERNWEAARLWLFHQLKAAPV